MKKNTKKALVIIIALIIIQAMVVGLIVTNLNNSAKLGEESYNSDKTVLEAIENSTEITTEVSSKELSGEYTNYTAKIDLDSMNVSGNDVKISENTINISNAGTFYFYGTTANCNINIETDKNSEVILVFENANITSKDTSVINVIKAKDVIINLADGSTNTFTDTSNYTNQTEEAEPDGTVFSMADLTVNGSGKLIVNANYKD